MIPLDIFADPVCPWCLIGKVELDRALESRPGHDLRLAWHPFRLNGGLPPEGMDRIAFLRMKLGERAEDASRAVAERAAALGLVLNPSPQEPDTTDAHRLLHWAGLEGAQTRVMSGLMRAHWRDARNIGDHGELTTIAQRAGMNAALTRRLLASDADRDEVLAREAHARSRGIASVPTFIVADRYAITGAQPADLWRRVIDEIGGTSD